MSDDVWYKISEIESDVSSLYNRIEELELELRELKEMLEKVLRK